MAGASGEKEKKGKSYSSSFIIKLHIYFHERRKRAVERGRRWGGEGPRPHHKGGKKKEDVRNLVSLFYSLTPPFFSSEKEKKKKIRLQATSRKEKGGKGLHHPSFSLTLSSPMPER